jgi:non-specific serine/threonine protein kinase
MSQNRTDLDIAAQRRAAEPGADFTRQVRDALRSLHDRTRLQTHPLANYASRLPDKRASGRGKRLQDDLLQAIEALKPSPQVASEAAAARTYQLLVCRYVDALNLTEVQRRLAIGKTEYYADHQRSLDAVASVLWELWQPEPPKATETIEPPPAHRSDAATAQPPSTTLALALGTSLTPPATIERPRHNLPTQLTSFVGREAVLADLAQALATTRLLTLTGVGGTGKTRLALQLATNALAAYPEGVWFVDLAPLADPALIPQTIAGVLGVIEQSGEPILTTVQRVLRDQHVLLILDNCEHLLDACARLADDLLRGCPRLQILATSREALGIGGEVARRVPSLSAPAPDQQLAVEKLNQYEAVQLFVERALAVQPAFTVTEPNAAAVARLCWRLDGIPLAIELAAARVRVLTVEQIASRLNDRFRLLTGGSRTALRRQQTLAAAIDWSHDLLSAPERTVFRRLAVFAGGWNLEAAEGVCSDLTPNPSPRALGEGNRSPSPSGVPSGPGEGAGAKVRPPTPIESPDVLDLLTSLVDKSLVLAEGQGADTRYRLLETIRQYAGEKLLAAGEAEAMRDRHLGWSLSLAELAKPELIGPRQVAWLDRLEQEQDNLRAALEWALEREPADRALRLAAAVWRLWHVRDRIGEGREWLLRVLAVPVAAEPTLARAEMLDGACEIAFRYRGDDPAVPRLGEECLAIYRALGDHRGTAWALCHLAHYAAHTGEVGRAEELAAEALALAREAEASWVVAQALEALGKAALFRGDYPLARRCCEGSLAIFREVGDRRAISFGLSFLCWSTCEQGDLGSAWTYSREALTVARELHSKSYIADALYQLGDLARRGGDLGQSRTVLEEYLALSREVGDRVGTGFGLLSLGRLTRLEGDFGRAESVAKECLAVWRDADRQPTEVLGFLGVLAISRGAHRRGARLLGATAQLQLQGRWLPLEDRQALEASAADARATVGEDAFAAAWAEGQAMTLEQTIAYALGDESPEG